MLIEILKIVLPLIGGGLAGAIVNEWLRRRTNRIQHIPLIERVNRLVTPKLRGFTLARVAGGNDDRRLEEITNLREYQLTLRNTSTIHLHDVEIQFEFPIEDVEGWASRPVLSKTALLPVGASLSEPWKKAFRWQIPYLPSTDSVEFSFSAIDPPSGEYEVVLYRADRVVIEVTKGEPASRAREAAWAHSQFVANAVLFGVAAISIVLTWPNSGTTQTALINREGCVLSVESTLHSLTSGAAKWPWSDRAPWKSFSSIVNIGPQTCVVQLPGQEPEALTPGRTKIKETFSIGKPSLIDADLAFGVEKPTSKERLRFYWAK